MSAAADRLACTAAGALLPAAILPPIAVLGCPWVPDVLGPHAVVDVFICLLLLAPGLVGLAAARGGLRRLARASSVRADGDHALAVWRILAGLLLFGYGFALAQAVPQDRGGRDCLAVAAVALLCGWGLLALVVLRPSPAPARRYCGIAADAVLLSAFLHFGGGAAAVAYPLYPALIFYSGWRFGIGSLAAAAGLGLVGFAAVIATTEFWRELPLLSAGLIASLAIVAAGAAALLRAVTASLEATATAAAARGQVLSAAGDALRQALAAADSAQGAMIEELRGWLQDAGDLLSVAAGTFMPPSEAFDLHMLVGEVLTGLRGDAAERGGRLTARIDPALPFQLRGARRQLMRILHNFVAPAIAAGARGPLRLSIDALPADGRDVRLRLSMRGGAVPSDAPGFVIVEQLAAQIGGEVAIDDTKTGDRQVAIILPLALDQTAEAPTLDLADRPVLIVGDDSQFAGELAEPLNLWRAGVRWIGGCETALDYLARTEAGGQPVLIVDGRTDPLPALSFVHRAATAAEAAPAILFVAAPDQAERIGELADGACDNVLVAPVSAALLGNALHAVPLPAPVTVAAAIPAASAEPGLRAIGEAERVTPITAHPRFVADPAETVDGEAVDGMAIEALRALGDEDFLGELIAAFRDEARCLIERVGDAAAAADSAGLRGGLDALRRCAGNLGGVRLCETASALRCVSEDELRQHGRDHVHRLAAELARLDAALVERLGTPEARRQ